MAGYGGDFVWRVARYVRAHPLVVLGVMLAISAFFFLLNVFGWTDILPQWLTALLGYRFYKDVCMYDLAGVATGVKLVALAIVVSPVVWRVYRKARRYPP